MSTHRITVAAALMLLLPLSLSAAPSPPPSTVSFQGRLTDAAGNPVTNPALSMTFKLYDVASGGTAVFTEVQPVSVVAGIYNAQIGSVTPIPATLFDSALWLGIAVGADAEMTPRYQLSATPYAIQAKTATALAGLDTTVAQLNQLNGISANVTAANLSLLTGGGNAGALHTHAGYGSGTITGVTAGTALTGGGTSGTVTLNVDLTALDSRYYLKAEVDSLLLTKANVADVYT
jgi:hypothetical protein